MNCDEIKEQVYDWSKGTLAEKDQLPVEKHLQNCQSCQTYAERLKHTVFMLNEVNPPLLSAGFKEMVLSKARELSLPSKPLWQRYKEWFQIPYVKWPLEGLAATVVILIALVLYRDINPTKPSQTELTPRSFQVEFPESTAKNPIVIPVVDLDKGLSDLKGLLTKNDGKIIQSLPRGREIQVTLSLIRENEAAFLARLNKIGPVQIKETGFRDDNGNIVVILKAKE